MKIANRPRVPGAVPEPGWTLEEHQRAVAEYWAAAARTRDDPSAPVPAWPPARKPSMTGPAPAAVTFRPRTRRGLPLIIAGAIASVAGIAGMLYISRAYSLCGSGIGALAQVVNRQAAVNCRADSDFHSAAVLVLVAGVILAGAGIIRMTVTQH